MAIVSLNSFVISRQVVVDKLRKRDIIVIVLYERSEYIYVTEYLSFQIKLKSVGDKFEVYSQIWHDQVKNMYIFA